MEQAGRDPSRDPQHDRTLDAMMSNTHTRAATGRRGQRAFRAARRKSQRLSWFRQVLLREPVLVSTEGVSCYLKLRLLRC